MNILERIRPDPIPAIHPMPEYLASGQRAEWYDDTKQVLQVPWMGVVTMAYALDMVEGFEEPEVSNFDIEAQDFDGLCRKLGV